MSDLDLDVLEATARAATPGPWEAGDVWVYTPPIYPDDRRLSDVLGMKFEDEDRAYAEHGRGLKNAAHIAAFDPSAALALIERVREAEAELLEVHANFAVQEGRLREAVARAEKAEAENCRLRVTWDKSGKNDLIARAEKAEASIERVRELHVPKKVWESDRSYTLICAECRLESHPCPTIRALGGDQS